MQPVVRQASLEEKNLPQENKVRDGSDNPLPKSLSLHLNIEVQQIPGTNRFVIPELHVEAVDLTSSPLQLRTIGEQNAPPSPQGNNQPEREVNIPIEEIESERRLLDEIENAEEEERAQNSLI